jgi:hypothetical protein
MWVALVLDGFGIGFMLYASVQFARESRRKPPGQDAPYTKSGGRPPRTFGPSALHEVPAQTRECRRHDSRALSSPGGMRNCAKDVTSSGTRWVTRSRHARVVRKRAHKHLKIEERRTRTDSGQEKADCGRSAGSDAAGRKQGYVGHSLRSVNRRLFWPGDSLRFRLRMAEAGRGSWAQVTSSC